MSYQVHVGKKCTWKEWQAKNFEWSDLMARLSEAKRTNESVREYRKMSKEDKLRAKDVGGFVAGMLVDPDHPDRPERKLQFMQGRSLIVLDSDEAKPDLWDKFKELFPGIRAAMHTTHSHTPEHPRIRLIVAPDRPLSLAEHEIMAHYITGVLGAEQFDASTYEPHRLMFWPSCPSDGVYVFDHVDGEPLRYDSVPVEWYDASRWPETGAVMERRQRERTKMGEPTEKPGIIGAFCRVYDIHSAIAEFLSDVYEPGSGDDRYTFKAGSSANGLQVFEDKFAFSHHGTDPAGGRECNAWDLVRIHLFGGLDADPDKDISQQPSQQSMRELALSLQPVVGEQVRAHLEDAREAFSGDDEDLIRENWHGLLTLDNRDQIEPTRQNLHIIMLNDEGLKDRIGYNLMTRRIVKMKPMPWGGEAGLWTGSDLNNLQMYLEIHSKRFAEDKVKGAVEIIAHRKAFHPVADMLEGLTWDGVERAERLLVTYMGAEDTEYVRAVTKAWLLGAVSRALRPGCTMQYMLLLTGAQGIGKSMFLRELAMDPKWFTDRVHKMDASKEAIEAITGKWIIEVGELAAMKRGIDEQEAIKAFLSADSDYYRTPYAPYPEDVPRSCVFAGTSNELDLLHDVTGGRRFWPVGVKKLKRGIPVDQIWAEVMMWYLVGDEPYLSPNIEQAANLVREKYQEIDDRTGMIAAFLDKGVPPNYDTISLEDYRDWYEEGAKNSVPRTEVSKLEVYAILFRKDWTHATTMELRTIGKCLRSIKGWEQLEDRPYLRLFGRQRVFRRVCPTTVL